MDEAGILGIAQDLVRAITASQAAADYAEATALAGQNAELTAAIETYNSLLYTTMQSQERPGFEQERSLSLQYSMLCRNAHAVAVLEAQDELWRMLANVHRTLSQIDVGLKLGN